MRVMVCVKATKSSEAGELPSEELLTAMGNYNEELVKAGIMLDGAGLQPTSKAVRVHFSGKDRTVIDGPFAETKELVAGFWIWRVSSMAEAVEWVKRCPNPMLEESDIDIRPLYEADDLGESFTPELREQEAGLLAVGMGLNQTRFEDAPSRTIAGLKRSYTAETRIAIPQHWEQFVGQEKKIPGRVDAMYYGVSWNAKPNCDFDYLTGVEVSAATSLPAEFTALNIPGRRYAVFPHTTHVSAIGHTIDLIWSRWALDCGLKIAAAPCFERYTPEFNPTTGMGGMEIWIPLDA